MRHVLSALVHNTPGVLAQVSGMLATRGFNIDSLAVGETEDPELSRMTFVVKGDDTVLEQVRKQLDKLISVVRVDDISGQSYVERDLMLLRVKANSQQRMEIALLVEMFRARVVDVSATDLMIVSYGLFVTDDCEAGWLFAADQRERDHWRPGSPGRNPKGSHPRKRPSSSASTRDNRSSRHDACVSTNTSRSSAST